MSGSVLLTAFDSAQAFKPKPIKLYIPKGWPKPSTNIFEKNKLTEEGFQLGKKLFYDGNMSFDGQTSCGSCHQQFAAFTTYDHDLSHGIADKFTERNAPALFNLAWMRELQWDGGVNHIEVQPLVPMTAHNEMGETLQNVLKKISADPSYKKMFVAAFGDGRITSERLLKALAQFTGSIVSADSRYDRFKNGKLKFTLAEEKGYEIYKQHCNTCHAEPLFTDNNFRNNGLDLNRFKDAGRQRITSLKEDSLKFKVPSLRNVQYTFPYMHDGRFNSLDKVINHYAKLDTAKVNLDERLQRKVVISEKEKQYLIYFLYTLTDTSFTKNKRYAPDKPILIKH